MVKIAPLDGAFSEFLELEASSVKGESLLQKEEKRRKKGRAKKKCLKT